MERRAVDGGTGARRIDCRRLLLGIVAPVVLLLPVLISHDVHRGYSLPRYVLVLLAAPLAGELLVDAMLARRLPGMRRTFPVLLLIEVAALAASAALRSADLRVALFGSYEQLLGLASYIAAAVLALAAQAAVSGSPGNFRWLLRALAASGVLIVLMGPCRQERDAWRWTGALGHANYTSNALLLPLFTAVGLSLGAVRRREAVLWAAGAAAMAVELVLLQTRGAWIAAAAGMAVVIALLAVGPLRHEGATLRRARLPVLAVAGALLALLASVLCVPSWRGAALEKAGAFLRVSAGTSSRLDAWRCTPGFLLDHLLAGTGPEGVRNAFLPFKSDELGRSLDLSQLRDLHSLPLQAFAEGGLAGLAAFLCMAGFAAACLIRTLRDRSLARQERWLAGGLLAAIAAHFVHGLAICHVLAAAVLWRVALGAAAGSPRAEPQADSAKRGKPAPRTLRAAAAACTVLLFAAAAWYCVRIWRADRAVLRSLSHAREHGRGGGEAALDAAIREGLRAVELAPEVGAYHAFLASTLGRALESPALERSARRRELLDLALVHAREAQRTDEKKENAALELARLHWLEGRLDLAEAEARASIAIDGHLYQSRRVLALLLLAQGRIDEARKEAEVVERLRDGPEPARLRKLIEEASAKDVKPPSPAPAQ